MNTNGNILIYEDAQKGLEIQVRLDGETLWLSLNQMAELYGRDKSVISKHLKHIFAIEELYKKAVVAKNATTAADGKTYDVEYFNLDAIISVGYRVNSKRGTQFRQWATQRLKDYLIKGHAINQHRLEQLSQIVHVIQQSATSTPLQLSEAKGFLDILLHYTRSFALLNQYDSNDLKLNHLNPNITYEIQYSEAKIAIAELKRQLIVKKEATNLFGNEKDNSFEGTLYNVVQTFGGEYLYPSIEEQAAHLLYFVIKNHPFSDGNKRIGSFLFVWFLEQNKHRFKKSGEVKINDNALIALALLVAQSDPNDKDLMIKLICNLIQE